MLSQRSSEEWCIRGSENSWGFLRWTGEDFSSKFWSLTMTGNEDEMTNVFVRLWIPSLETIN